MNPDDFIYDKNGRVTGPKEGVIVEPQCRLCYWLSWSDSSCPAFPNGIPGEVFWNLFSHKEEIRGDNGFHFLRKDIKPTADLIDKAIEIELSRVIQD